MIRRLLPALSFLLVAAIPAGAAIVTEAAGQFSRHWQSPTVIGAGVDTILGAAEKQNGHEFLALTGLASGPQTLSFSFLAPDWALSSYSYSAGGQIFWSTEPFRWGWDGTAAGSFQLSRWMPRTALDLVLGEDFAGTLHLGIYFTHGSDVSWSLSMPPSAPGALAAVPLTAAGGYVLGGLSILAAMGIGRGARRPARG